jgi:hypothetical protein
MNRPIEVSIQSSCKGIFISPGDSTQWSKGVMGASFVAHQTIPTFWAVLGPGPDAGFGPQLPRDH